MYLKLQVNVIKGLGRFIPTPCHAEPVYGRVKTREAVSCVCYEEVLYLCYINRLLLTVKTATLIFISGCGSAISSAI